MINCVGVCVCEKSARDSNCRCEGAKYATPQSTATARCATTKRVTKRRDEGEYHGYSTTRKRRTTTKDEVLRRDGCDTRENTTRDEVNARGGTGTFYLETKVRRLYTGVRPHGTAAADYGRDRARR